MIAKDLGNRDIPVSKDSLTHCPFTLLREKTGEINNSPLNTSGGKSKVKVTGQSKPSRGLMNQYDELDESWITLQHNVRKAVEASKTLAHDSVTP